MRYLSNNVLLEYFRCKYGELEPHTVTLLVKIGVNNKIHNFKAHKKCFPATYTFVQNVRIYIQHELLYNYKEHFM